MRSIGPHRDRADDLGQHRDEQKIASLFQGEAIRRKPPGVDGERRHQVARDDADRIARELADDVDRNQRGDERDGRARDRGARSGSCVVMNPAYQESAIGRRSSDGKSPACLDD